MMTPLQNQIAIWNKLTFHLDLHAAPLIGTNWVGLFAVGDISKAVSKGRSAGSMRRLFILTLVYGWLRVFVYFMIKLVTLVGGVCPLNQLCCLAINPDRIIVSTVNYDIKF